jgi:hypothetical protein
MPRLDHDALAPGRRDEHLRALEFGGVSSDDPDVRAVLRADGDRPTDSPGSARDQRSPSLQRRHSRHPRPDGTDTTRFKTRA